MDALSGALVTAGLAGSCSVAPRRRRTAGLARVLVPAVAGLALVALFLVRQRSAAQPLLPLWVLADRSRAGAYLAVAVSVVGSFGMFLMLTYHFQVVLGYVPVRAGLAFLPLSAAVSASAYGLGSRLLPLVAPRCADPARPGCRRRRPGLLVTLDASSGYLTTILPAELLLGLGMGLVFTPGDQRRHERRRAEVRRRGRGHRQHRHAGRRLGRHRRAQQSSPSPPPRRTPPRRDRRQRRRSCTATPPPPAGPPLALALTAPGRRGPDPHTQAHRTPEGELRCPSS